MSGYVRTVLLERPGRKRENPRYSRPSFRSRPLVSDRRCSHDLDGKPVDDARPLTVYRRSEIILYVASYTRVRAYCRKATFPGTAWPRTRKPALFSTAVPAAVAADGHGAAAGTRHVCPWPATVLSSPRRSRPRPRLFFGPDPTAAVATRRAFPSFYFRERILGKRLRGRPVQVPRKEAKKFGRRPKRIMHVTRHYKTSLKVVNLFINITLYVNETVVVSEKGR